MDAKIPIRMALPKLLARAFLAAAILIAFAAKEAAAQQQCVSAERVKALKTGIETLHDVQPNPTLKTEILELRTAVAALNQQKSESVRSSAPLDPKTEETVKNAPQRVCSILNSQSWPIKSTVGSEAANAWINLVRNYLPP